MRRVQISGLTHGVVFENESLTPGKTYTRTVSESVFSALEGLAASGDAEIVELVDGEFSTDVIIRGNLLVEGTVTQSSSDQVKTVTVGNLAGGAITAATAATGRTYPVTTAYIANGKVATVKWYTTDGKAAVAEAPAGIAIAPAAAVASNALTLNVTVDEAAPTVAASYYFTVTVDKIESAVKTLVIGE